MERAGVSSMKSGAVGRMRVVCSRWRHCSAVSLPLRTSAEESPDSATMRRIISCTELISSEKKATGFSWSMAMLRAMERTKAVLPIEGRAAMMMGSEGCHPSVSWSRRVKPVGTPFIVPPCACASSMAFIALSKTRLALWISRLMCPSETLKISASA